MFLNFYVAVFMACNIIYGIVFTFKNYQGTRLSIIKSLIISFTVNQR